MNCAMCDFFWSGQAHTYYGLIGIVALSVLIVLGIVPPGAALIVVAFIAGAIFIDEFLHGYQH